GRRWWRRRVQSMGGLPEQGGAARPTGVSGRGLGRNVGTAEDRSCPRRVAEQRGGPRRTIVADPTGKAHPPFGGACGPARVRSAGGGLARSRQGPAPVPAPPPRARRRRRAPTESATRRCAASVPPIPFTGGRDRGNGAARQPPARGPAWAKRAHEALRG